MAILWTLLTAIFIVICIGVIFLILIQETKSGGLAGVFGTGGGSQTLFGSSAFEFVQKATLAGVILFFLLSVLLSFREPTVRPQTELGSIAPPAGGTEQPAPEAPPAQ